MTFDIKACDKALQRAKIGLMTKPDSVFFSDLLLSFKCVWKTSIPTASVGGMSIWINPEFFMNLKPEEQIGLLVHEVMHPAYMHPYRLGNRDPYRHNIACDHVINLELLARGFSLPPGGYADRQYIGMTSEQVYDLLPNTPPPDFNPDIEYSNDGEESQPDIQEAVIRAVIRSKQESDKPGTVPGDIQLFVDNLLNPKVKWSHVLAKYKTKFAKTEYSFTKPRRRYLPMILPGLKGETLIDIAVAADISGSVTDEEFLQFVGEFAAIFKTCKPEKITLLQFDTQIKSIDKLESVKDLMAVKFHGRGGTAIGPVINWAEENKPQLLLVFTDGEFKFHSTQYSKDLMWIIHNNPKFTAPYGKVTHYKI